MVEIKGLTLHEKLIDIQQRLEVKKLRENEFGGFMYRNVEDIEAAVKPFLKVHKLTLTFSDDLIGIGGHAYVKATAVLSDNYMEVRVSAFAREMREKKKMDDSQLTGGASSYARKYAANGLFLIDDGRGDPDNPDKDEKASAAGLMELSRAKTKLFKAFKDAKIDDSVLMIAAIEKAIGKQSVETVGDAEKVIESLEKTDE